MTGKTSSGARTPRHASAMPKRRRLPAALAVAAVIAAPVGGVLIADAAHASTDLLVNSLGTEAAAGSLTDGVCQSTAGTCTLRAAIQEANAINGAPGQVVIGVNPSFAGGNIPINATTTNWMMTTTPTAAQGGSPAGTNWGDGGAIFVITAPVTIDLGHKITIHDPAGGDSIGAAVFYLNGPNITLQGMDDVYSAETSIYVGPQASNILITDTTVKTPNYYPERYLVVRGGATNVTLSYSTIRGFYATDTDGNWGVVNGTSATWPVNGLTIDNVNYLGGASGSCSSSAADGCSSKPVYAYNQYITGLTFTNNLVTNTNRAADYNARALDLRLATVANLVVDANLFDSPYYRSTEPLIDMGYSGYGANITNLQITNNTFTNMNGNASVEQSAAAILLPGGKAITGAGLIQRNTFVATGTGNYMDTQAVYWQGPYGTDAATNLNNSNMSIVDNYFDGFSTSGSRSSIRLYLTGLVEVARNTFGPRSNTQTNTTLEEYDGNGSYDPTMLNNWNMGANAKMNTWYPTARTAANVQATPIQAVACEISLDVAPPSTTGNTRNYTSARQPATPAYLDVYWTANRTAEVYLGRFTVTANAPTTLTIPLPMSADDPALATNGGVGPVDPATGAVTGGLRVQTIDPNAGTTMASSQYSRVATIGGTCAPDLTIAQRDDQAESALTRDRVFRLTSTIVLDPASVTAEDFALTGSTARNAHVVDVIPVVTQVPDPDNPGQSIAQVDGKTWDVVVHADDSGSIVVNVAVGAVTADGTGFTNIAPAHTGTTEATNNVLTYVNPLRVTPAKFALVLGEPHGKDYTLSIDPAAPVPADDVYFASTLDEAATQYGIMPDTLAPRILAGNTAATVNVVAPEGAAPADTPTVISHTVSSTDENYDGLVVPSVSAHLFATDPTIRVDKLVYTNVTDDSTPAQIQATGTLIPSGTRLVEGTPVWFVFQVTNTSADDWATSLTDVEVTDDALGAIGTVPTLAIGSSTLLTYGPYAISANAPVPLTTPTEQP